MSVPVQGLAPALYQLDPARVAWAHAAAQRLAAHGFEATVTPARGAAGSWYRGDHLAFVPLRDPPAKGAAAEDLVRLLSAHDDVLDAIELATGLAAEFTDFVPLAEDWPVIALHRAGEALARIAVLSDVAPLHDAVPPAILRLGFVAARLLVAEAQRLEAGDLLVLSHGPWPLVSDGTGAFARPGIPPLGYDPATGVIAPTLADDAGSSSGAQPAMTPDELPDGLTVPVTVHLADTAVTQAELARMAQTGTFDLGAVSEGLRARLSIGGRSIGEGEIVRLGDRFAVLLETPASVHLDGHEEQPGDNGQEAA